MRIEPPKMPELFGGIVLDERCAAGFPSLCGALPAFGSVLILVQ